MVDSDDRLRTAADRRSFLSLAGATGLGVLVGTASGKRPIATSPRGRRGSPRGRRGHGKRGHGPPHACDAGPLSPLPTPDRIGVPRPTGEPGGLEVLDWAGFESAVSYSFDDSQPSHIAHYDELHETGIDMTFYLSKNVDFEGYEEGWRRVAADGHEIGNHTVSHPYADLTGSSFGEPLASAAAEIERCSEYITDTLGQRDVWTMAAPYGDTGWSEPAERADLFINRGVGGGTIAPNDDTDPYDLPCYMASDGETADAFNGEIDGARSDGDWLIFLFHSIAPTDDEWFAPVDVSEITDSIRHAQSFGDVWIDTVANIAAYWRGQRIVESATVDESGDEITWRWSLPDGFPSGQRVRVTLDGGVPKQGGRAVPWDPHGYYEISLDEGSLTVAK